ncbi:SusC/RagA family TonB-linked outer membrane protein [Flavobacterium oreochromis]|uniref:SusC/RagA family TonB-linked outer membrane protein n=1 Tax=Flavobacterium oreochromis TaxID=2906078 RepID=UPI00385B648D
MRSKFKWIFTLLLALTMQFSFAQEKTITGVVTDANGPLPGVNVVVKGTQRGVSSGFDGKYSIKAKEGETLVFSFMGMREVAKVVGASNVMNTVMQSDAKQLGEVVVQAYGRTTTKAKSNGAQGVVSSKDIEGRPNVNFLSNIQGQAAGVNIAFASGTPGTNKVDVIIRGQNSLSGSNEPLYVIDGMPLNQSFFRNLNPDDIESVVTLKDAAASAIYGNRGANGVIIITTKKGKLNSAMTVRYTSNMSFSSLMDHKYNLVNSKQHLNLQKIRGVGFGSTLSQTQIDNYAIDTNWKDEFYRVGITQNHNLSLMTGSEKISNYTSLGYLENQGILKNTDFKRITFRTNFNGKSSNDRFKYSTNINANYSKRNQLDQETRSGSGGINSNVLQNPLNGYLYSASYLDPRAYINGQQLFNQFGAPSSAIVPYMLLDYITPGNIPSFFEEQKLIMSLDASYKLTKDLTYGVSGGLDYSDDKRVFARAPWAYLAISAQTSANLPFGGFETNTSTKELSLDFVNKLNYLKVFGQKHAIDLTLYTEYVKAHRRVNSYTQNGLDPKTYSPGAGTGWVSVSPQTGADFFVPTGVSALKRDAGMFSYFGVLDYDYDSIFGLNGAVRRDSSYKFTNDNKWGTFWSMAGRVNIHKLDILKTQPWINELKLRGSYGSSGNQNIEARDIDASNSAFFNSSQRTRSLSTVGSPVQGYNGFGTFAVSSIANTNLRWETTYQSNIGLDFNFFNKLSGTIDVYRKTTKDLFIDKPISPLNLVSILPSNSGAMRNEGIELLLKYKLFNKENFKLSVFANGSYNQNKITELPLAKDQERIVVNTDFAHEVGGPAFQYFLVPYLGVNKDTGEMNFLDINGNVTTKPTNSDRRALGINSLPKYQGGFGFDTNFYGFTFNALFTYKYGFKRIDDEMSALYDISSLDFYPVSADLYNAWTTSNINTDIPSYNAILNQGSSSNISDRFLRDASFLRLRTLTLGYEFSNKLLKDTGIKGLKLYGQAENIFTITKWRGFDPDNFDANGVGKYPTPRVFSFGLDVQF